MARPGPLTRWQPFAELEELRTRFDKMFNDLSGAEPTAGWRPDIDVVAADDKISVHVDVPGYKSDEIKLKVEGDVLTISGEHHEEVEDPEKKYVRRERRYGAFSRPLVLPEHAQADAIEAITKDGVLDVTIPLTEPPAARTHTITPKAG